VPQDSEAPTARHVELPPVTGAFQHAVHQLSLRQPPLGMRARVAKGDNAVTGANDENAHSVRFETEGPFNGTSSRSIAMHGIDWPTL
jgi:hypothetical protein